MIRLSTVRSGLYRCHLVQDGTSFPPVMKASEEEIFNGGLFLPSWSSHLLWQIALLSLG